MTVKINTSIPAQSSPPYAERLNGILQSNPSAETIDTYGPDTLQSYADLVGEYTDAYSAISHSASQTGLEIETEATSYWDLPPVESVLDELSARDLRIKALSAAIAGAALNHEVITPPDLIKNPIVQTGNANFEPAKLLGKAKVTLYVLENDFGVDVTNPSEIQIDSGVVDKAMVRQESYLGINVPQLDRLIMVCDESRNATYVFNIGKLEEIGLTPRMILRMHKSEYRILLKQHDGLGRRIFYSDNFTDDIRRAIAGDPNYDASAAPSQPEGILTVTGMQGKFGVTKKTLQKFIKDNQDTIGNPKEFSPKGTARTLMGYDNAQQNVIEELLVSAGYLVEKAPEGVLSENGMIETYGVSARSIRKAEKALGDNLGLVKKYRFDANRVPGFTLEQQEAIIRTIKEEGYHVDAAPDGSMSINGMSEEWGLSRQIIQKAITEMGSEAGQPFIGRSSTNMGKKALFYLPNQQEIIYAKLKADGHFAEIAPEGVLNLRGLANKWHINDDDIRKYIDLLGDALGSVEIYKFGQTKKKAVGYSPEQQAMLLDFIRTSRSSDR